MDISDRIHLTLFAEEEALVDALKHHKAKIAADVLALNIEVVHSIGGAHIDDVNGLSLGMSLQKQ